jgi:uncharacterized protein YndB with AHSA1/START domain
VSAITREVFYAHPRERVWAALTDPEALAQWLMPNDFEPVAGREFTFRTKPGPGFDGVVHCRVLELDAPSRMAWSWRGGPIDTVVRFELEPVEGGTRLRFEQTGFAGLQGNLVRLILGAGFRTMYRKKLPAYLEGRTVRPEAEDRGSLGMLLARIFGPVVRR